MVISFLGNLHNLKYKIILAASVTKIVSASYPRSFYFPTPPPSRILRAPQTLSRLQAVDAAEAEAVEVGEAVAVEAGAGLVASRVRLVPPLSLARSIPRHSAMAPDLLISSPLHFRNSQSCLLIQVKRDVAHQNSFHVQYFARFPRVP